MKRHEPPIPLRSVVCLPRWLVVFGVSLSVGCMLAGVVLAAYAIGWTDKGVGGWLGGAFGCLIGGGGALFGTLRDWRRRLPATAFLHHIRTDEPSPFYRRVFKPALVALVLGVLLGLFVPHRAVWQGIVKTSAILVFIAGSIEIIRRHTTRQARAVFALYADGALAPDDTAAIDDARQKDTKFDADVRAWLEVSERLREYAAGEAP